MKDRSAERADARSRSRTPAPEVLDAIRNAMKGATDGVGKADVLEATGLSSSQWNVGIKHLIAAGEVIKTGERRSARYHLKTEEA